MAEKSKFTPFAIIHKANFPVSSTLYDALPTNAQFLLKSFLPKALQTQQSEQNITPAEQEALATAYKISQQRVNQFNTKEWKDFANAVDSLGENELIALPGSGQMVDKAWAKKMLLSQNTNSLQYQDYPINEKLWKYNIANTPLTASYTDPAYNMATTIGRANYKIDDQGNVHVVDRYDFPKSNSMKNYDSWSPAFKFFHGLGEEFSNPMNIDINLGKITD